MLRSVVFVLASLITSVTFAEPGRTPQVERLMERARGGDTVQVLVRLEIGQPFKPEGHFPDEARALEQRARIAGAQSRVAALIAGLGGEVHASYEFIPFVAAHLNERALAGILRSPLVVAVEEDAVEKASLPESTAQTGAVDAWSTGLTGQGWTVAVLDSGVDKFHPFLQGKVVSEACYSSSSFGFESTCPGGVKASTKGGSGMPCYLGYPGCDHGTHVAGIIAGRNSQYGFSGVARDASIISINVFSYDRSSREIRTRTSDQLKGLERVYALRKSFRIAAVNMSIGGGKYDEPCDFQESARKTAFENLRSVNIAPVVSAGNDGWTGSMGTPACISNAISVGSVCDAADTDICAAGRDGLATYSNIDTYTTLVAPGSFIASSIPLRDGWPEYANKSGTSMAAPHVAGAFALLKQRDESMTVSSGTALLRQQARTINDTRPGGRVVGLKRLDLGSLDLSGPAFPLDVINNAPASIVTSNPRGITCGNDCFAPFAAGSPVTLTATPAFGMFLEKWTGDCTGSSPTCTVNMSAARSVTAAFLSGQALSNGTMLISLGQAGKPAYFYIDVPSGAHALTVSTVGVGNIDLYVRLGSVPDTSVYDCFSSAWATTETSCRIKSPAAGRYFVMLNGLADLERVGVTALYTHVVKVLKAGTGSGTVFSSPRGISCGAVCSAEFTGGSNVELSAVPAAGSVFSGWSGACVSSAVTCTVPVTASAAKGTTATFNSLTPLTNGQILGSLAGAAGSVRYFYLDGAGTASTNLTIKTSGGSGNVDLAVRYEALPTLTAYDCFSASSRGGNTELCSFSRPSNIGRYYVMLYGAAAYSGVSLVATLN